MFDAATCEAIEAQCSLIGRDEMIIRHAVWEIELRIGRAVPPVVIKTLTAVQTGEMEI